MAEYTVYDRSGVAVTVTDKGRAEELAARVGWSDTAPKAANPAEQTTRSEGGTSTETPDPDAGTTPAPVTEPDPAPRPEQPKPEPATPAKTPQKK